MKRENKPFTLAKARVAAKKIMGNKPVLSERWIIGGTRGGNCWDDSRPENYILDSDEEPNFDELDLFLVTFAPDMTFLEYKILNSKVAYSENTIHEYYGNYINYRVKTLVVEEVLSFLQERGYVE